MLYRNLEEIKKAKFEIPKIEKEVTLDLYKMIKPIVKTEEGYFNIKEVDPIQEAFTWAPKILNKIENKLELIDTVYVLHDCYYGFYKGSMEEVFAFINKYEMLHLIDFIEATFECSHESGSGVISKINLFRKVY